MPLHTRSVREGLRQRRGVSGRTSGRWPWLLCVLLCPNPFLTYSMGIIENRREKASPTESRHAFGILVMEIDDRSTSRLLGTCRHTLRRVVEGIASRADWRFAGPRLRRLEQPPPAFRQYPIGGRALHRPGDGPPLAGRPRRSPTDQVPPVDRGPFRRPHID